MGILACQSLRSVFCLGMALGGRHCQGPAPGPFLSSLKVTPMRPPCWALYLQPSSVTGVGFLGRTWPQGRQAVQDHTPTASNIPPPAGARTHLHICRGLGKHDHLPPLPTPSRPPAHQRSQRSSNSTHLQEASVVVPAVTFTPAFQSCNHTECACSWTLQVPPGHTEAVRSPVGRVTCSVSAPRQGSRAVCRGHVRCAGSRAG